jgi:hypothetical protein
MDEMSQQKRVETGALKINDDWTGVFIRGDHALMLYLPVVKKLRLGMTLNAFDKATLDSLIHLLDCKEGSRTQEVVGEVK